MGLNDLEVKKSAVLFFDILNGYYHQAPAEAKLKMEPMVDNAVRLMKAGRSAGIPIFFARGYHRADSATSKLLLTETDMGLRPWPNGVVTRSRPRIIGGEESAEVIAELEPRSDDYHILKYRWSAFFQTYLDLALRARAIDTIIISGGSTDVGIAATVFAGRDLDYHMIVVRDACGSSHDLRAHDTLMDLIFPRMARVRTTDQAIDMIRRAAR